MENKPEIFFSYAWGDASDSGSNREKIVNDLYESLKADGFNVIRDKNDLRYKGLISELTSRIGRGKFIVVAISDKYLKSTYCMSELLEIYRRSNSDIAEMLKKIFPIVLDDAKLYTPEDRVDYLSYWEDKKDELNKELKEIELENVGTFADDLHLYDEITSVIPILSRLLRDMNTLNPQRLSANNFAEIKEAIIKAASSAPAALAPETINTIHKKARVGKFGGWKSILITLVALTLLAVFLHLRHVSSTRIRMELSVSEVNFALPQQQVVTNIMKLSSIGASGLENIRLPAVKTVAEFSGGDSSSAILLSVDTTGGHSGSLAIDALPLPAGTRIGFRNTDVSGEHRLSLQGKAFSVPVQADGFIKIILPPHRPEIVNLGGPGIIYLQSGKDGLDLDIDLLSPSDKIFPASIEVDSISLLRIDENFDNEVPIVRTVSTVLSGTIAFESYGEKKLSVPPGKQVRFKSSHGTITTLEQFGDHLSLTFVGNVSGMTTGDNNNTHINIMPTYLDSLKSRLGLPLLVLIVLLILGSVIALPHLRRSPSNSK